jgi:hypothetical protein
VPLPNAAHATLPAPTVGIINTNDLFPGGFAIIVALPVGPLPTGILSCSYKDLSFPFFRLHDRWYAVVPIPFTAPAGTVPIGISMDNTIIASINAEIKNKPHKTTRLGPASPLPERILERIEREKRAANAVFSAYDPLLHFTAPNGFVFPVRNTHVTDQYGTKRVRPSRTYYHAGVDFRARSPEKIFSIANGIVAYTGSHFLEGNMAIVSHGAGIYSCYIHLSKIKVKVGQAVHRGQCIAYSGKTGAAARGPHLHFLIKAHNIPVDPLAFIKIMNALQ